MIGLIQKRHSGNGWHVFTELANATGGRAERRADAVAVGLWPSNGYEIHGYEIKNSRADLQRDLSDMTKSHAVGKYCDYWWLVVDAAVNLDGLVIPKQWGILVPRNAVLRVVRKATKRKTTPVDRGFNACMIRHATEKYVPLAQLQAVREELYQAKHAPGQPNNDYALKELRRAHDNLLATIQQFKEASGIDIHEAHPYRGRSLGAAVKMVIDIAADANYVGAQLRYLDNVANHLAAAAARVATACQGIRDAEVEVRTTSTTLVSDLVGSPTPLRE